MIKKGITYLIFIFLMCACNSSSREEKKIVDSQKLKEQFVKANRHNLQREKDIIEQYIRTHQLPYKYTPAGIYLFVVTSSDKSKADSVRPGNKIKVEYSIYLLDGTLCYASKKNNPALIVVEQDNTESGIHRGLQMLKTGDRARMIIPSYLAHGLMGDGDKIPPQSPILVDITVLTKEK